MEFGCADMPMAEGPPCPGTFVTMEFPGAGMVVIEGPCAVCTGGTYDPLLGTYDPLLWGM